MKAVGIGWVRRGFDFPFEDKIGGKLSPAFLNELEEAKKIRKAGLQIMGITNEAGEMDYDEKDKKRVWRPQVPNWAGSIDSDTYYDTFEKGCEEVARQTKGLVDLWQVSNEMDIEDFKGPLSTEQVERFLVAGGRGLKKGNPQAKVGINPAMMDPGDSLFREVYAKMGPDAKSGEKFFRDIYSRPDNPFDYAGIDGYFGSWSPGGPQEWVTVIEKIHEITGKPVLINEWGYSSLQGSGKPLKKKVGNRVCDQQS
jgi:hypothetical protein